ncbi:TAXI family TRAP transporter solute-binding subunit [Leucobacter luti]|uniref:TAXI family TRAP transporter solute-binding subunit n=1 Tax=Leucobacter luti TaxID=340320 RepID=UPI003CFF5ACF
MSGAGAGIGGGIRRRTLLSTGALGAAGLLAGALPALTGCAPGGGAPRISMACGEPGGTYIRFGQALGRAAKARGIASAFTARETGGSADNIDLLLSGEAELGIALIDTAVEARDELVSLGRVYQNYLQCVVLADSGLRRVEQLAGRSVSIGATGSGTAESARRTLAALGLEGAEGGSSAQLLELRLADAVTRLAGGSIDALFWSGGLPVPELTRIEATSPVTLLDLSAALPPLIEEYGPLYQEALVPANVYGSREPLPAIGVSNLLLARPTLPAGLAEGFADVLIDDAELLIPQPSYGMHFLSAESLIGTMPIPLHAAAERRYAERYG